MATNATSTPTGAATTTVTASSTTSINNLSTSAAVPSSSLSPSTAEDDDSFWDQYRVFIYSGGAALVVFVVLTLFILQRRRASRRRRLPRTNTDGKDHNDDGLRMHTLGPSKVHVDSSPTHLQSPAMASLSSESNRDDQPSSPVSHPEPDTLDETSSFKPLPTNNPLAAATPSGLIDQYAPAHDHGYIMPSRELSQLETAVANSSSIAIIPDTNIQVQSNLESGHFGHVHRASYSQFRQQTTPTSVLVKMLAVEHSEEVRVKLLQDALIRCQFCHPKLQSLVGVVVQPDGKPPWLVLEDCSKGRLDRYLRRQRPRNNDVLLRMTWDLIDGIHYLNCCGYVVGDLAAQHVLVTDTLTCKLANLGLARDVADPNHTADHVRIRWAAPETLPDPETVAHVSWRRSGDSGVELSSKILAALNSSTKAPGRFSSETDVWSFGVLLWELWHHGALPYDKWSEHKLVCAVAEGYRLAPGSTCIEEVYRIMIDCWHPDPTLRPTFASLLRRLKNIELTERREPDTTRLQELQETYVTDADKLAAIIATKSKRARVKPGQSPSMHRLKAPQNALSTASSVSGSFVSGSNDDSAFQSAALERGSLSLREPSRTAPRRLAPLFNTAQGGGMPAGRAVVAGSQRPRVFNNLFSPARGGGVKDSTVKSLQGLPMVKDPEAGYIDIAPSDNFGDIARTFPRLKAQLQPIDHTQAANLMSALDARLEREGLESRPLSFTRGDSDDRSDKADKEDRPTALAIALQGAAPNADAAASKPIARTGSLPERNSPSIQRTQRLFDPSLDINRNLLSPHRLHSSHHGRSSTSLRNSSNLEAGLTSLHTSQASEEGAAEVKVRGSRPLLSRWQHHVTETSTSPNNTPEVVVAPVTTLPEPVSEVNLLSPSRSGLPSPKPSRSADAKRRLWTLQSQSSISDSGLRNSIRTQSIDSPLTSRLHPPAARRSRPNSEVVVDESRLSAAELAAPGSELDLLEAEEKRFSSLRHQWSLESDFSSFPASRRSSNPNITPLATNPTTPALLPSGGGFVPEPTETFTGFGDPLSPLGSPLTSPRKPFGPLSTSANPTTATVTPGLLPLASHGGHRPPSQGRLDGDSPPPGVVPDAPSGLVRSRLASTQGNRHTNT
eukprot:TRINITY_DN10679_c0_g1_i2.p1 TRINITY_DN10679_c0_g1~~TRINITY_DN10679_c0_g1_i2.p1  ORF type:complete len:1124 (+),score=212.95 TRINITY_DN10679_c0_g1_i2:41-3412(+)